MKKAIDCANFTDIPTPEQVACLLGKGYTKAIVGTSYGTAYAQQIAAFRQGGMEVAEYQWPQRLKPPLTDEVWIDVELDGLERAPTRQQVEAACERHPRGIYSSQQAWKACGFDGWDIKAQYPDLKVWYANYGTLPRPFPKFGGFTKADIAIVQWAGSVDICNGLNVDLNVYEEEPVATLDDEDRTAIADIVRAEVIKALGIVASTDPQSSGEVYKRNIGDIVKLQNELTRIDMEKTGQLPPRH